MERLQTRGGRRHAARSAIVDEAHDTLQIDQKEKSQGRLTYLGREWGRCIFISRFCGLYIRASSDLISFGNSCIQLFEEDTSVAL